MFGPSQPERQTKRWELRIPRRTLRPTWTKCSRNFDARSSPPTAPSLSMIGIMTVHRYPIRVAADERAGATPKFAGVHRRGPRPAPARFVLSRTSRVVGTDDGLLARGGGRGGSPVAGSTP